MSNKKTNAIPTYHKHGLPLAALVASQMIGFDLAETDPVGFKFINSLPIENTEYERTIKEVKWLAQYNFFKAENQLPVSKQKLEQIKQILARDANIHSIERWEITNGDYDMYRVTSPSYTWSSLCGRDYIVDLMNDTVKLIRMS